MTHYLFHEAGSIPGIPGTFAHCRVDIDDEDGTLTTTPLLLHPHELGEATQPLPVVSLAQEETPREPQESAIAPAEVSHEDTLPEAHSEASQAQETHAQELTAQEAPVQEEPEQVTPLPHSLEPEVDPTPAREKTQPQPIEEAQPLQAEPTQTEPASSPEDIQPLPAEGEELHQN